jgi:hypothetical protein
LLSSFSLSHLLPSSWPLHFHITFVYTPSPLPLWINFHVAFTLANLKLAWSEISRPKNLQFSEFSCKYIFFWPLRQFLGMKKNDIEAQKSCDRMHSFVMWDDHHWG